MKVYSTVSPNGSVCLNFTEDNGKWYFSVSKDGTKITELSPMGLKLTEADLSEGLVFEKEERSAIDETYTIPAFKKAECLNRCSCLTVTVKKENYQLSFEGRAYDDGAAFRMVLPGEGTALIDCETTAFRLPETVPEVTAMKWLCSYEDHYHPVPAEDLYQNLLAFPVLFRAGKDLYGLYTEAAAFGNYGGSILKSEKCDPLMLYVKKATDKLDAITSAYPVETPWRVVMCGSLASMVESNLLENLNPESIVEDPSFIKPGVSAWAWMTENYSARDEKRMRDYVDFAADMGWPYSVVDGGWPGYTDIAALVKYAEKKNIGIWIWEHSAAMRDPKEAEEKMKLWSSWGVKGLKIDFFESDSQERVEQFSMLAELAVKYRLMLNFHGCLKPAGYSRVWPHVLAYEGVQGGEYLQNFSTFTPGGPDAAHNCTLPFTRNVQGPMDYTPICYETYRTGTTDAHQTALSVIFTAYVMHCGENKDVVEKHPHRPFLEKLYTAWDETRLLEGAPASYVTMMRKKGEEYFLGGICARRPRNAEITFDFLTADAYEAELYCDDLSDMLPTDVADGALGEVTPEIVSYLQGLSSRPCQHQHDLHKTEVRRLTVKKGETLLIPESVNGGFAMYLKPVK